MTLLVADADRPAIVDALPSGAATVPADDAPAAAASGDHEVVVVATEAVLAPGDVVEAVRIAAPHVAVVAVGDVVVNADATAADADELPGACERARRVAAYRDSVSELYAACREHALGDDRDVRERRREADALFEELPEDDETFAAALRSTDGDAPEDDDG
ncbi:hypothetical protein [Halobacterium zhouii]|uniref:hypothetical protein n=1 Tax=Halobacterium zhouii TaxID=2902624 RepID=UPI001E5247CE|nr:hypothetical protein [Halobacterium zhouii]